MTVKSPFAPTTKRVVSRTMFEPDAGMSALLVPMVNEVTPAAAMEALTLAGRKALSLRIVTPVWVGWT